MAGATGENTDSSAASPRQQASRKPPKNRLWCQVTLLDGTVLNTDHLQVSVLNEFFAQIKFGLSYFFNISSLQGLSCLMAVVIEVSTLIILSQILLWPWSWVLVLSVFCRRLHRLILGVWFRRRSEVLQIWFFLIPYYYSSCSLTERACSFKWLEWRICYIRKWQSSNPQAWNWNRTNLDFDVEQFSANAHAE